MTPRRRRPPITADDAALWARVISRVKPLAETPPPPLEPDPEPETPPVPEPPGPRLLPRRRAPSGKAANPLLPLTHGSTAGVDKRTAERFRKGAMEIEARLDLHGLTREAAYGALTRFLREGAARGRRMVLIITGKGLRAESDGVLKAAVPRWLNEPGLRPLILSFTYAQPRDGGEGALYVFLKRDRGE
jgi:DNA-nicking Smr family endonuclease